MRVEPFFKDEHTTLYCADHLEVLPTLESESVALTVTSPPYDDLREYKGYKFNFERLARELYRVTMPGGVVVWVVADEVVGGSETGTSFRQALYFLDVCKFRLNDTMIFATDKPPRPGSRYGQEFEYMFVLSKGTPRVFNGLKRPARTAGQKQSRACNVDRGGTLKKRGKISVTPDECLRGNIWHYRAANHEDNGAHPAPFPEKLVGDHVLTWTKPGDLVLDPMSGSGTVAKVAKLLQRPFIGIDVAEDYCVETVTRLAQNCLEFL